MRMWLSKEEACLLVIVHISLNILIPLRAPRETAIIFLKLSATIIWIFHPKVYIKVNNDRLSAAPLEMKSTLLAERCTTRYWQLPRIACHSIPPRPRAATSMQLPRNYHLLTSMRNLELLDRPALTYMVIQTPEINIYGCPSGRRLRFYFP